jgi:release factor glutamine methyltransferase
MTTIRDLLEEAKRRIATVSTSASLDAQLLLAEVIQESRAHVIAHPEKSLTPAQITQYWTLIDRRANGEPVAYLLGRQPFYDREFVVTHAVLVPRPETEHLLEFALDFMKIHPQGTVADIGTGSGALAITLAAHYPQATVYATDISSEALAIARLNAEQHDVTVTFLQGDLLLPLVERNLKADLLLANLPYIPSGELLNLSVSRHEPHLALDGGPDGLNLIRRLLAQAPQVMSPGGMMLLEIGADQGKTVTRLAGENLKPRSVTVHKDYAGLDRVVMIRV